jgi:hypothetical protein
VSRWGVGALSAALALCGCELREITLAAPQDVVVAEVILRAGSSVQTAFLHRTSSEHGSARVFNANIVVTEPGTGRQIRLQADADSLCLLPAPPPGLASIGTCYVARGPAAIVHTGVRYTLRIELQEGGVLTGETTVPGPFRLTTPSEPACYLEPHTDLELTWTPATGTSVYITSVRMAGLLQALRRLGVDIEGIAPVELIGLSVTAADTTILFPTEIGLFDRFDDELHPVLVALQNGVPADVVTELSVTAADRNYVNWIRGGNFNPSGLVRISSLRGDGAGVFGALVTEHAEIRTTAPEVGLPGCR